MPRTSQFDWQAHRQRMLDQTSRFIEWGLRHPEQVIEIPAKPVGEGSFPRQVGEWFWSVVLAGDGDSRWRRWRDRLLRRPKIRISRRKY